MSVRQLWELYLARPELVVLGAGIAGFFLLAVREGWWRQKLRSWWWLVRHRSRVAARRAVH